MSLAEISYSEHMAWCKERALAYVDRGELDNAMASLASDFRKHPDTDHDAMKGLCVIAVLTHVANGDVAGTRRFIEGFAS